MNSAPTPPAGILAGLRVIEVSAFVAAPLGGATLAEMGADVIRVDPLGGGIDAGRWPLHNGHSLYWAGLNQGKRSVTLDLRSERGRGLLVQLVTHRDAEMEGGILLTNLGIPPWLSYERLSAQRPDLIMLVITGNPDGSTAVDYTVNAAIGFPYVTGPLNHDGPVNHVLPAWDALTGYLAATSILAAERHRRLTRQGQLIQLSLMDVALAVTGHLGLIAEAQLEAEPRTRFGNELYGSFARDFATGDGRSVFVVALTARQWNSLCQATGLTEPLQLLERRLGLDFSREGDRFTARRQISALIEPWVAAHNYEDVRQAFENAGVLWGPYQTFQELVSSDPRCSPANPLFADVEHPGIGNVRTAGSPIRFGGAPAPAPSPSPAIGQHTDSVLRELAGVSEEQIRRLREERVID
jgi:2-methylfumaryl-CoA isomerase